MKDEKLNPVIDSYTDHQQEVISKAFWNLAEKYELKSEDVEAILGQDIKNIDFKKAQRLNLKLNKEITARMIYMIAIHQLLRVLYPHNPSLTYSWMKTKTTMAEFAGKSPIEFINENNSLESFRVIKQYLEFRILNL